MGLAEPLEQLTKQVVKHTPVGKAASEFVQEAMPGLHHLLTGAENVKITGTRRTAHPRAFSSAVDFQGAINSGRLQNYTENELPKAWQHNFAKHYNDLDPDGRADFTDLLVRAANGEAPAKMSVMQTARTLDIAQQADMRQAKARRTVQQNTIPPEAQWPNKYEVTGSDGFNHVHDQLSKWLNEQKDLHGGDIDAIDRSQFAPEGIFIDGEERFMSGVHSHLQKGSRLKLNKKGTIQARLDQMDPAKITGLRDWLESGHQRWIETDGEEGVHPDLTFEDYRANIKKTAKQADDLTSQLAKLWGIKLDKEHMIAIGNRATDDARSQFPGSETYNRRMGKLDSFTREVMELLGLPGAGGKPAKKFKSPQVQAKADQRAQIGWFQSITDWVATDGGSLDDMGSWNPGNLLTASDKARIQQAMGKNQVQVAMQILAQRQILEAARKAGFDGPDELKILQKILKDIDVKEKIIKAKRSVAEKDLAYRTSQSKQGMNEPTTTRLPSQATGK